MVKDSFGKRLMSQSVKSRWRCIGFALIVFLCDFSILIYLLHIMRFCSYRFFLPVFLLISLQGYAADSVSPASSVSAGTALSDKTTYIEAQEVDGKKDAQMEANGHVGMQQGTQKVFANH